MLPLTCISISCLQGTDSTLPYTLTRCFLFRLSGLDLPLKNLSNEFTSPLEKVKSKLQEAAASSSTQNGVTTKVQVHEVSLPVPESTLHLIAQKQRQKYVCSGLFRFANQKKLFVFFKRGTKQGNASCHESCERFTTKGFQQKCEKST